jgi:Flp pilus assembly protein TadD
MLGQYEVAIQSYDEVILLNPEHVNAYVGRALAKAFLGRDDEAMQDVLQAVALGYDPVLLEDLIEEAKRER